MTVHDYKLCRYFHTNVCNAKQNKILNQSWQNEVSDCNEATENNIVYAVKGTALNRPVSLPNDTYFTVWCYSWDGTNITQFASAYGKDVELYCRKKSLNGTWNPWKRLV